MLLGTEPHHILLLEFFNLFRAQWITLFENFRVGRQSITVFEVPLMPL
jgi:hypothetical protein